MTSFRARPIAALLSVIVVVSAIGIATSPGRSASGSPAPPPGASAPLASPSVGTSPVGILSTDLPLGATAPIDDASRALVARIRSDTFGPDAMAATVEALARSGIGTYATQDAVEPVMPVGPIGSPIRLLGFQAHALALGMWAHGDYSGSELDTVMPLPAELVETMPTASDLLAAYVATADTPGGALARALMTDQDLRRPSTLRFPAVVMTLFVSDLATDGGTRAAPPAASGLLTSGSAAELGRSATGPGAPPAVTFDTACSSGAAFVDRMIHSLFTALELATPKDLVGAFLVGIWNWLWSQGEALVHKLIAAVTDQVLGFIRSMAGIIAMVVTAVASLVPATMAVHTEASSVFHLLPDGPLDGVFVADVSTGGLPDWPALLKDCAQTAGVTLPDLTPKQLPVAWGPLWTGSGGDPLIYESTSSTATDDAGEARWAFTTGWDPGPADGEERSFLDSMPIKVHRPGFDTVAAKLKAALLGGVPEILRSFVGALLQPTLNGIQERLNAMLDTRGTAYALIIYHEPAEPTPSPTPSPSLPVRPPPRRTPPPPLSPPPGVPGASFGVPDTCDEIIKRMNDFLGTPSMDDEAIKRCIDQYLQQMLH